MSQSPNWNDIEREEAGIHLVLPLSVVRSLSTALPRVELAHKRAARSPRTGSFGATSTSPYGPWLSRSTRASARST
jgi:hypothetical protein